MWKREALAVGSRLAWGSARPGVSLSIHSSCLSGQNPFLQSHQDLVPSTCSRRASRTWATFLFVCTCHPPAALHLCPLPLSGLTSPTFPSSHLPPFLPPDPPPLAAQEAGLGHQADPRLLLGPSLCTFRLALSECLALHLQRLDNKRPPRGFGDPGTPPPTGIRAGVSSFPSPTRPFGEAAALPGKPEGSSQGHGPLAELLRVPLALQTASPSPLRDNESRHHRGYWGSFPSLGGQRPVLAKPLAWPRRAGSLPLGRGRAGPGPVGRGARSALL